MGYYEDLARKKMNIPKKETPEQIKARQAKAAIKLKNVLKVAKFNQPGKSK